MTLRAYPEEVSLAIDAALTHNGGKIVVHDEVQAEAGRRELEQKQTGKEGEIPTVEFVVDARQKMGTLLS